MPALLQRFTLAICLVLAGSALFFYFGNDLWNDEIYTLQNFVFRGIGTVLTDYHVPNNHILSNIFHRGWLQLTGVNDLGVLLDAPWRIRLLPLCFSALAVWWVYRAGQATGDRSTGLLAALLLLSGLTFQAYAFQVRGYALSMTASAGLSAWAMRWANGERGNRWNLFAPALLTAALLYTLPSNAYFGLAVAAGLFFAQGTNARYESWKPVWPALGALAAGAVIALAAYWPVLNQLLGSTYFESKSTVEGTSGALFSRVMADFFSYRWLLAPLAGLGVYQLVRTAGPARKQAVWLLSVLLLPFLFSALRGDAAPDRVFLPALPVFALLLAISAKAVISRLTASRASFAYAALVLYSAGTYAWGLWQTREFLRKGLDTMDHYYPGLNRNYYQHFYQPNAEYDLFRQQFGTDKTLVLESSEEHDMPVYLQHKKQVFVPLDSIETYLRSPRTFYVSSNYARSFMQEMSKMGPGWRCRYLQNKARIPRIVICEPTGK
ncbi:MAG TPA: hypothetical protein PLW66_01330 [Saprospiraceae bacterium]|nr:hypothetical protein [Saprospiraceae bacterium]